MAELACIAEVLAPKAGNVHPGAAFDDATWQDFALSAVAVAPLLDRAAEAGVGKTVLACVEATKAAAGTNTNLGMILLLAPLCAVPRGRSLGPGVRKVLADLTAADARAVYEAIRLAHPGGLGRAGKGDVARLPKIGLVEAMSLAAERDAVARQYANGFADVLGRVAPALIEAGEKSPLDEAIVRVHLGLMAHEPDSLIRRKCGDAVAQESSRLAGAVLAADWPRTPNARRLFARLDRWLRADGRRRNPGTSADLVAAGLFVAFRGGSLLPPWRWAGLAGSFTRG
ncbi:MAG: triphosphoribosyl-dephospho-CoA synthase [Planctomycetota bacterium]|nr:triphosphoribosyl-dephospho-CoA synthase [Planctomycetota bacterium]